MIYNKEYYISQISERSSKYGSQLIEMMEYYDAMSLSEITLEQAKEFYKMLIDKDIDDSNKQY